MTAAPLKVGRRIHHVSVERLASDEQAAVWRDVVVTRSPAYANLPSRSGRTIPVFRLLAEGAIG